MSRAAARPRVLDLLEELPPRIVRPEIRQQQRAVSLNRGQQVIEVVRDPARELPDRFHLLGLLKLRLDAPLLGHVPLNGHVVRHRAGPVPEWRHAPLHQELCSVVAVVRRLAREHLAGDERRSEGVEHRSLRFWPLEQSRRPAQHIVEGVAGDLGERGIGVHDSRARPVQLRRRDGDGVAGLLHGGLEQPERGVGRRELGGALLDPPLQFRLGLAELLLDVSPLGDFSREGVVDALELRRTGDGYHLGNEAAKQNRGGHRGDRRQRLHPAGEPPGWHPDVQHAEPVGRPAREDEGDEAPDHPVERKVSSLAQELSERERDGHVRGTDQRVGAGVQPD